MAFSNGPTVVTNGLVLSLDAADRNSYPGSGTTWTDISGNGNNGTLTNGPTFSSANQGAIVFDGTNDYTNLGTSLGNNFTTTSVNLWTKPSSLLTGNYIKASIIGGDDGSSTGLESVFCTFETNFNTVTFLPSSFIGRSLSFGIRTTTQLDRTRTISIADEGGYASWIRGIAIYMNPTEYNTSSWINITGVYDGVNTLLYVNSILKATSANQPDGANRSVTGLLNTSTILRAMSSDAGAGAFYNGNIASAQIYNRALTASEVLQNYNATKTRFGL